MRAATALLAILLGCQPSRPPSTVPSETNSAVRESLQRAAAARARGELDAALREYRYVLAASPGPDQGALARQGIVEIELGRILAGDHSSLPQPQEEACREGNGYPILVLENHAKSALHVFLHGGADQMVDLAPESSSQVTLAAGEVRIGIRGDDPSSLPLLGDHTYNVWQRYRVSIGDIFRSR